MSRISFRNRVVRQEDVLAAVPVDALVLEAADEPPASPEAVDELDVSPAPFEVELDSPVELVDVELDDPDFDPLRLSVL